MKQLLDDIDFARTRLVGGFALHRGVPVHILDVGGKFNALCEFENERVATVPIASLSFNFSIGYLPSGKVHWHRCASRQWKQSLTTRELFGRRNGARPTVTDHGPTRPVVFRMLSGNFEWRGREVNHAFHKDWALADDCLYFRGELVGSGDGTLLQKYFYLAEALHEAGFK